MPTTRKANREDVIEAQKLAIHTVFDNFYQLRDWLDLRFPDVAFDLSQEEDLWFVAKV